MFDKLSHSNFQTDIEIQEHSLDYDKHFPSIMVNPFFGKRRFLERPINSSKSLVGYLKIKSVIC